MSIKTSTLSLTTNKKMAIINIKNKIEKVETSLADDDSKVQEIEQVIDLSVEQDNFTVDKILSLVTFV